MHARKEALRCTCTAKTAAVAVTATVITPIGMDTKYEVNDILKVNEDDCGIYHVYYLTFTVTNGEKEYFQAEVVERFGRFLRVSVVRPRLMKSAMHVFWDF
ncbi:hypothetical protein FXO38_14041 [Capsicum annuum]|nr:hypothetical protein FXO38_14041 [Capsicum annuum]KAF3660414.1 hypothetical protein FXO37_13497 [Capsicum annuum]